VCVVSDCEEANPAAQLVSGETFESFEEFEAKIEQMLIFHSFKKPGYLVD